MSPRRLVVTEFVSLDGVTEAPDKWSLQFWNDDVAAFKNEELDRADIQLLGRVTYDGFAASWPTRSGDPFTDKFNSMPKYVVSGTLQRAEWNNSQIIRDDPMEAIRRLKSESGGDIIVYGSMQLVNALARSGLIDEYRMLVYPLVLGSGKRLFTDGTAVTLNLTSARALGPVAALTYAPPSG